MKRKLISMLLFALSGLVQAAGGDDHTPRHGGIVIEAKAMDLEVVLKPDVIHVYLRDHEKPMSADKATGKITLLNGNEKQEVALTPAADRLEARGTFKTGPGTKGVVQVTLGGKTTAGRFALK